jgi:hypothetical protein
MGAAVATDPTEATPRVARVLERRHAWVVIALCGVGCGGVQRNNRLTSQPVSLREVGAPHESIVRRVGTELVRIYLDTGETEIVGASPGAFACGSSVVHAEDEHFVIVRPGTRIVVDGVVAGPDAKCAPDGTRFAIARAGDVTSPSPEPPPTSSSQVDPTDELIVVELASGQNQRFAVPAGSATRFEWMPGSEAVVVGYPPQRLDVATGTIAALDGQARTDLYLAEPARAVMAQCSARGLRIARRIHAGRQELVLEPTAAPSDPERLSTLDTPVLVVATNYTDPPSGHGLTKEKLHGKRPRLLGGVEFTSGCTHYVFELEGTWYVGSVATRRFSRLSRTGNPQPD